MAEQRKESRSAASLKVKYKSATVDEFAQQFGTDVSRGGIFIKTKSPLEPGALLKLELQLSTTAAVISGIGRVAWRRAASQDPARPAGMGIKFIKLEPASQAVVERIVHGRGATPSRFDQTEGAELARASLEPPTPTSLAPERASSPHDAPSHVRPPASFSMPAAAPSNKPLPVASKPVAAAASKPAPIAAPVTASAAASLAASRQRIGPTKAAIPSGLFANSPLVQAVVPVAAADERRTSFFPPAPASQPAARGGSMASGQLTTPRSSAGSVSSPLNRPRTSRAPALLGSRASAPGPGPKGVFGGPAASSPLASSASGVVRPAKEVPGVSSSSFLPDRSADELPTAAVSRPPGGRGAARGAQASAAPVPTAPSVLESLADDVFGEAASDSDAASIDGMFATLELDAAPQAPPARGSRPSGSSPIASRLSPAPLASGRPREPNAQRGLAAAEAADVDHLFADLEGADDAPTDEIAKPAPASAVFSPGSTRPSLPPGFDGDLAGDQDFGEADLLGDDRGVPPSDDGTLPSAALGRSERPRLRFSERPPGAKGEEAKRSPALAIGIGVVVLAIVAGAIAFAKPELLGLRSSTPEPGAQGSAPVVAPTAPAPAAKPAEPAAPSSPTSATTVPAAPPTAARAAALPSAEVVSVNITSLPRGADVRVAGVVVGTTPTNIDLPLGREAIVSVGAQGYTAQTKTVAAARGMEPLRFKLEPLPYVLVVTTTPTKADVTVGSVSGVSSEPLALGHISSGVDVTVAKDGYRRVTRLVRLEEFSEQGGVLRAEIEVTLSPMPGTAAEPPSSAAPPSSPSRRRGRANARPPEAPLAPPEPAGPPGEPPPPPPPSLPSLP